MTWLRAESSQPPACPSKTTGVRRRPFRWHLLTVSWNVRFIFSTSAKFWGGGRRRTWVSCGGDRRRPRNPRLRESRLSMEDPDVSGPVMTGLMWKAIRLRAGLEQACLYLRRTESCFLGGFVHDMGDCAVSEVTISRAWAVAWSQKQSRTCPQRVHCEPWSKKGM